MESQHLRMGSLLICQCFLCPVANKKFICSIVLEKIVYIVASFVNLSVIKVSFYDCTHCKMTVLAEIRW